MLDKMELSLDDIIKSNKQSSFNKRRAPGGSFGKTSPNKKFGSFGGGIAKGRARGGITRSKYTRGDVNSSWKHDLYEGQGRKGGPAAGGLRTQGAAGSSKLVVSNLDFSVSDADINELFAEFGPLKTAAVHYDRSGRSLGTADVVFERKNDALKAMKQYNGVPLDGRPMSIQLATSDIQPRVQLPRQPSFRPGTARSPRGPPRGPRRGGNFGGNRQGGGGGGRRPAKTEVTVEDLNAELDAYTMQG